MEERFEAERDTDCRTTIIRSLTGQAVAYKGENHWTTPSEERGALTIITIPDSTRKYLMKLWVNWAKR